MGINVEELREYAKSGLSSKIIAEKMGFHVESIRRAARRYNIKFERGFAKNNAKKLLAETCEAYYWMGVLLADGSFDFNDNSIRLRMIDYDTILGFKEFVEARNKVSVTKFPEKKWSNLYGVKFCSKKSFNDIVKKFDINKNKTENPPTFLPTNNAHLILSMLIGMMDGDASMAIIRTKSKRITIDAHHSWLPFFERMRDDLKDHLKYEIKTSKTPKNEARLFIGDQRVIKLILEFIDEKKLPVLDRKWNKIR